MSKLQSAPCYPITLNVTEVRAVSEALLFSSKSIKLYTSGFFRALDPSDQREMRRYLAGLAARFASLGESGIESQAYCERCGWYGLDISVDEKDPVCPSCRRDRTLISTRGGQPLYGSIDINLSSDGDDDF